MKKTGEVTITGGEFRGRKVKTPGGGTHPMGERERLALFNMILGRVSHGRVADLFCGGGTLGIEALSRGAEFVLFVDKNNSAVEAARENLAILEVPLTRFEVNREDAAALAEQATEQYDVVLADPPYDKYSEKMVEYLPRLVIDGGILVLSHPGVVPELKGVRLDKTRKYAGATISVYVKD